MNSTHKINLWQGAALLATTLLGTGVFILPQLTIAQAGHAASWAWLLLTILAIPVTFVFAALARVLPHAAGPAHFVGEAFGTLAGRITGLMFVLVVPLGASAAMMMTYSFAAPLLSPLLGDLRYWQLPVELFFLLVLWQLNRRGVQLSAKLQLGLTLLIVAVVVLMFAAFSLQTPHIVSVTAGLESFNPSGFNAALALGFWSFLGVEAMTHLAQDFRDPKRHLVPALLLGLLVVGCIYLACSHLLLILAQPGEDLSMADGFNRLFGGGGYLVIGVLGLCSGLATVNVYTASVARLCWSFSSNGVLPKALQPLNRHQVPERALGSILILMAIVLCGAEWLDAGLPDLIGWVNGVFVLIYLGSMTAALRLLPVKHRVVVWLSIAICLSLVWMLGTAMSYAVLLVLVTAPLLWWQQQWLRARVA